MILAIAMGSPLFMFQDLRSILFQLFSLSFKGHWIVFLICPHDGKAVIFDSLWDTNKEGYKDFNTYQQCWVRHILYALKVHIKLVVDTSGWNTTLTGNTRKTLNAMIGGPKKRSRSMAQNCTWGDNFWYVWRIIGAITSCMLSMCPNDYVLHISCM